MLNIDISINWNYRICKHFLINNEIKQQLMEINNNYEYIDN